MSQHTVANPGGFASAPRPIWTALACAALLAAVVAAWSNSFQDEFVFDDLGSIRDNPTIRNSPSVSALAPPWQSTVARRPIVNLSLAINYAISGLDVRGYHLVNLMIHLCAALLLFGIVGRTLLMGHDGASFNRQSSIVAVSFAVALIWALHPLQTESVTYVVQRAESLAGLFYLATLYCVIRGAFSGHPWRWYSGAIAACALGVGAKEYVATAPVFVLLYDRAFLSGSFREALLRRRALYAGLAATWAILIALCILYPWGPGTGAGFGLRSVTAWQYALTEPGVLLYYLRLAFWPHPLCLDYRWPVATSAWEILAPAAAVAALLAGTLWALRRAPKIGTLAAWFFLVLAPTSSIVPLQDPCAEHRMYLPLAAVVAASVLAAAWIGDRLIRHVTESDAARKSLRLGAAIVAVLSVAVALGCATYARNRTYRDAISIWQDTVERQPSNVRAWTDLGYSYVTAGRFTEAISRYDHAIELKPNYAIAYNDRAEACIHVGRYAQAQEDCLKAVALEPDIAESYVNLGNVLMLTRQREQAIGAYDKAIELKPGLAKARLNRAVALVEANRLDSALQDFDAAIALDPDSAEACCQRAGAYTKLGRCDAAIRDCDRAIAINPGCAEAYNNRATASLVEGRFDQALRDCEKAIALTPDFAMAYANRGDIFCAMNRFPDAIASYDAAIQRMPSLTAAYCNRATVYFSLNRMEEAIRDYTQAIALQPDAVETYCDRATAYVRIRQYEAAVRDCDRAIALKPGCAAAYGTRAAAYAGRGMYDLAIRDCTRSIALKPDDASAYNNRAYAHYQLKEFDKALADMDTFRKLGGRPDSGFLKNLLHAAGRTE